MTKTLRARHQALLGGVVEVKIEARSRRRAQLADRTIVAQIERLESVFSPTGDTSDLRRFRQGNHTGLTAEFEALLSAANDWGSRSDGAFDPRSIDLDSFARGYITDQAIDRAMQLRPSATSITLSTELHACQRGEGTSIVGVGDPGLVPNGRTPAMRVELHDRALATVANTGVALVAHVVASDAMTADALGTILLTIGPVQAMDLPRLFGDSAWAVVDTAGEVTTNPLWADVEAQATPDG